MLPPLARVYLDSNILIHVLNAHPLQIAHIEALISLIERRQNLWATSELTIAEVLTKPMSTGDEKQQVVFEKMFDSPELSLLPVSRNLLVSVARLRGQLGIKLPDAIHVAAAVAFEAKHFLTEDRGISVPEGIQLLRLSDLTNQGSGRPEATRL